MPISSFTHAWGFWMRSFWKSAWRISSAATSVMAVALHSRSPFWTSASSPRGSPAPTSPSEISSPLGLFALRRTVPSPTMRSDSPILPSVKSWEPLGKARGTAMLAKIAMPVSVNPLKMGHAFSTFSGTTRAMVGSYHVPLPASASGAGSTR
ncbi:hypothetical protein STIAU_6544 [Stigmatella aurantiaca DW4/3-1]|uniref:Uncharacterized protein n=1 Tax=Stigmatella aurantiaca (strain DW4/3-1) TaxID=378806 RepID=Q08Q01_STIAD|nr:hypothetical protein STIAU_6544 [Stigmatella aurantiaca DW4/3-1]